MVSEYTCKWRGVTKTVEAINPRHASEKFTEDVWFNNDGFEMGMGHEFEIVVEDHGKYKVFVELDVRFTATEVNNG